MPLFCQCGQPAFVRDVMNNPYPENPNPCRECYWKMVQVRHERAVKGIGSTISSDLKGGTYVEPKRTQTSPVR